MLHAYINKRISEERTEVITNANEIIAEYQEQGYCITLRQLYYQFVSRNLLENSKRSYQRLCSIIKDGRMAGMIDWDTIVDRTRQLQCRSRWDSPEEILESCSRSFHLDLWEGQSHRVEIWIEKDALISVIEDTCNSWDCPYLACRGYNSASEMREAAQRIIEAGRCGYNYTILYAGDHDPSGSDMSRDIESRLRQFGARFDFRRIALNREQVSRFNLPPNKIKDSDSRSRTYRSKFGTECWELDALPPSELVRIIDDSIEQHIDHPEAYNQQQDLIRKGRETLKRISDNYSTIANSFA
ncbi:MAG: hypothetical protein FWE67_14900 [Planctomycetaceae bacterium]|nr:hypothetical protein [Planctomycetaceae bacterium]